MQAVWRGGVEEMKEVTVKVESLTIEESKSGEVELVYIPSQTQVLEKGKKYKFDLDLMVKPA
jgi:hypothetical protein